MAEVQYTDMPDVLRQNISDVVNSVREYKCPTLDSLKGGMDKVTVGENGYQIAKFYTDYGQNSYMYPGSAGNSFKAPVAPETQSMFVGVAYQGKAMYTDGFLLQDLDSKQSLIKASMLRELAIENFMKHQNYYAIGVGNAAVAFVTSVAAGVFTGTTAAQVASGYTKGAHRLVQGVTYDIVDESSFAVVGTITPTANGTNSATVAVTSTGLPNNAGALVVEQGAYNKVPRGLAYLINSADRQFQGLDTTTRKELNSSVVDLNGSAITSSATNTLKARVQIRTNAQDIKAKGSVIAHTTPGLYRNLAIQGFGARQYQASEGQNNTSYGYPQKYIEDDGTLWILDADMDEDRLYLRTPGDFGCAEMIPFRTVNRDGLELRQSPGLNGVGAESWYSQVEWVYNSFFSGDVTGGNTASAYIQRAAVTAGLSQVTSISG